MIDGDLNTIQFAWFQLIELEKQQQISQLSCLNGRLPTTI